MLTHGTLPFWQGQEDSNPRPTVLETGTLPAELYPCITVATNRQQVYYITYESKLQPLFHNFFSFLEHLFKEHFLSAEHTAKYWLIVAHFPISFLDKLSVQWYNLYIPQLFLEAS